jgi:hypothetical protein
VTAKKILKGTTHEEPKYKQDESPDPDTSSICCDITQREHFKNKDNKTIELVPVAKLPL